MSITGPPHTRPVIGCTGCEALYNGNPREWRGCAISARLEYLRGEIRAERISWGELAELQSLAEYIEPGDTELLEAAGVPEHPEDEER